jgi:hypothetical protein
MKIPKQTIPIKRNLFTVQSLANSSGVESSRIQDCYTLTGPARSMCIFSYSGSSLA